MFIKDDRRPQKDHAVSLWHEEATTSLGSQEESQTSLPTPSSSQKVAKLKVKAPTQQKPKKKAASPYQVKIKERQEKVCFTCEKKACTSCRKTPQEIFQTRQTLWAKALQEETLLLQKKAL